MTMSYWSLRRNLVNRRIRPHQVRTFRRPLAIEPLEDRRLLETQWSGDIGGMTWGGMPGNVDEVVGDVTIPAGTTLIVRAGAIVKFHIGTNISIAGTIITEGTSEESIYWTSILDDSVGGDTNGNGEANFPSAGDWGSVRVTDASANVVLAHMNIRYAGRFDPAIEVVRGQLSMDHVDVRYIRDSGLQFNNTASGTYTLTNVSMSNIGRSGNNLAIFVGSNASVNATNLSIHDVSGRHIHALDAGRWTSSNTSLTGTGVTAIIFEGGAIIDSRTLDDDPIYFFSNPVTVTVGATLTIPEGKLIKLDQNGKLIVKGTLLIEGTRENVVTFTSIRDDSRGGDTDGNGAAIVPTAGDWSGIVLQGPAAQTTIGFLETFFGGRSNTPPLHVLGGVANVADSLFANSDSDGIGIAGGTALLERNRIQNVDGVGLRFTNVNGAATLTETFVENAQSGAYMLDPRVQLTATGTMATGSAFGNAIIIESVGPAKVEEDLVFQEELTYVIRDNLTIQPEASLTWFPGTVAKYEASRTVDLQGGWIAIGTPEEPIHQTTFDNDLVGGDTNEDGNKTLPGTTSNWRMVVNGGEVMMRHVHLSYMGVNLFPAVQVDDGDFSCTECRLEHTAAAGVSVRGGADRVDLSYSLLRDVDGIAVLVNTTSNTPVALTGTTIEDATDVGVQMTSLSVVDMSDATFSNTRGDGMVLVWPVLPIDKPIAWTGNTTYVIGKASVGNDLEVVPGGDFTVNPGTNLKFYPFKFFQNRGGRLTAIGDEAHPINITSVRNDAIGGDSNSDGDATLPFPGDFAGFWQPASETAETTWNHVIVSYAGLENQFSAVWAVLLDGGVFDGEHVSILKSADVALGLRRFPGPDVNVRELTIDGAGGAAINIGVTGEPGGGNVVIDGVHVANINEEFVLINPAEANAQISNVIRGENVPQFLERVIGTRVGQNVFLGTTGLVVVDKELTVNAAAVLTILPETVVKMRSGTGIVVDGRLLALGSPESRIIITSIRDDRLEDTNGDGMTTEPVPGIWEGIEFRSAGSHLLYTDLFFAQSPLTVDIPDTDPDVHPVSDARFLAMQLFDSGGIPLTICDGSVDVENSVIVGGDPVGPVVDICGGDNHSFVHNTLYGGSNGFEITGPLGRLFLQNNAISGFSASGIRSATDEPVEAVLIRNNMFSEDSDEDIVDEMGTLQVTVSDGNMSLDPLHENPGGNDFRLQLGSELIDAAFDPSTDDLIGNHRHNEPGTPDSGNGLVSFGEVGALEYFPLTENVESPTFTFNSAEEIDRDLVVHFTVANGGPTPSTEFSGRILIHADPEERGGRSFDLGDVIIAAIPPAGAVSATATFPLGPEVEDGDYLVKFDSFESMDFGDQLPAIRTSISSPPIPRLQPGVIVEGDLYDEPTSHPYRDAELYEIEVPPGCTARVIVQTEHPISLSASGIIEISHEFPAGGGGEIVIPTGGINASLPIVETVEVFPLGTAPDPAPYTVVVEMFCNELSSVSPREVGRGLVTLSVEGSMPDDASFHLERDGQLIGPSNARVFGGGHRASVTFNTTAVELGTPFDVVASFFDGTTSILPGALTVTDALPAELDIRVLAPGAVRAGDWAPFEVHWSNSGKTDVPTHLLKVSVSDGAQIGLSPNDKKANDEIAVFSSIAGGTNSQFVPPGASGSTQFYLTAPPGNPEITLSVQNLPIDDPALDSLPFSISELLQPVMPPTADPEKWREMIDTLDHDFADNWGPVLDDLAGEGLDFIPKLNMGVHFQGMDGFEETMIMGGGNALSNALADMMGAAYPLPAPDAASDGGPDSGPAGEGDGIHRDFVLIVAMQDYSNTVDSPDGRASDLPGVKKDLIALLDFYKDHLGIADDQFRILWDHPFDNGKSVATDDVTTAWQELVDMSDADDKIKFHYTGHGGSFSDGSLGVLFLNDPGPAGLMDGTELRDMLQDIPNPGKTWMSFDSCESGAMLNDLGDLDNVMVQTACMAGEVAPGVDSLTQFWTEASKTLSNDLDGDGKVTLFEAFAVGGSEYVYSNRFYLNWVRPQMGGDLSVDQELTDDLGTAAIEAAALAMPLLEPVFIRQPTIVDRILSFFSLDPNEKVGPVGVGDENYVPQNEPFNYAVYFENDPEEANAPAQVVTITDQLSTDLDWSTFEFGPVVFGDTTVPLDGTPMSGFARDYDFQSGLLVDIVASFDPTSGEATWTFSSIAPQTNRLTRDPRAGFLPPNVTSPEGEGHVTFSVQARSDVTTNLAIGNSAQIIFDTNEPIITNEHILTFDLDDPTSSVQTLTPFSPPQFTLSWAGTDVGSGVATYDVFVSTDNGEFEALLSETTETSTIFIGDTGREYAFYSVATDRVFRRETKHVVPDTVTRVTLPGDGNLDGTVDAVDLAVWSDDRFQDDTTWDTGDYNFDTVTDGSDFNIWNEFKFQSLVTAAQANLHRPPHAAPNPVRAVVENGAILDSESTRGPNPFRQSLTITRGLLSNMANDDLLRDSSTRPRSARENVDLFNWWALPGGSRSKTQLRPDRATELHRETNRAIVEDLLDVVWSEC